MDNIYFKPNEENGEFLEKLEGLDEYSVPQILDRMVEHFRTFELKDVLIKLGIKTDTLENEEEVPDNIKVEKQFYSKGKPKRIRHLKKDIKTEADKTPLFEKEWYENGQLRIFYKTENYDYPKSFDGEDIQGWSRIKSWYENGQIASDSKRKLKERTEFNYHYEYEFDIEYYPNGQIATELDKFKNTRYYDTDGNEMKKIEWIEGGYGKKCDIVLVAASNAARKNNTDKDKY